MSLFFTQLHSLSHTHTLAHMRTLTHTHTLSLSHTHTHAHMRTLTVSSMHSHRRWCCTHNVQQTRFGPLCLSLTHTLTLSLAPAQSAICAVSESDVSPEMCNRRDSDKSVCHTHNTLQHTATNCNTLHHTALTLSRSPAQSAICVVSVSGVAPKMCKKRNSD